MAFCGNCGAQAEEGKFCPNCGSIVGGAVQQPISESNNNVANQVIDQTKTNSQTNNQFEDVFNKFTDTTDKTSEFDSKDIQENKVLSLFAYLGILVLIPFLAAKDSKFAQYHAKEGLNLLIWVIIYNVAMSVINGITYMILPWTIYKLISFVLGLGNIVIAVISIIGIINALSGKAKELPLMNKIKLIK